MQMKKEALVHPPPVSEGGEFSYAESPIWKKKKNPYDNLEKGRENGKKGGIDGYILLLQIIIKNWLRKRAQEKKRFWKGVRAASPPCRWGP